TLTDAEGRFEFVIPQAEAAQEGANGSDRPAVLLARRIGFLSDTNNAVSPGTPMKGMIIRLVPEALIVGKVTLPTSDPPDRIQIHTNRRNVQDGRAHWVFAGSTATKSSGEFRIADLTAGTYKVLTRELLDRDPLTFDGRGQLQGYPPVYFPAATGFGS